MTNKFKNLRPYFGESTKKDSLIMPKKITGSVRKKMIKEMVSLIRENKRIMENYSEKPKMNNVFPR